jgi:dipeptidyl-peptidase-4
MKKICLILLFACLSAFAGAQNKLFTVKDTEIGSRRELAPKNLKDLQWRGGSGYFTYQENGKIFQQSVLNSTPVEVISLSEINRAISKFPTASIGIMPQITWENENEFHFFTENYWFVIKVPAKEVAVSIKLPEEAENFKVFYPKKLIACTVSNNVFLIGTNNTPVAVTTDSNPDIVNGDIVSRNEFGIKEGLFWSPAGNYLAFYRKNNSKVGNYPLVDITTREAELKNIKYPMAGMASEHLSLGIYRITDGLKVFVEKDDTLSEKYLTNISWAPDEKNIYIQVLNRQQNHLKLNKYKISDGSLVQTLFEEKNDKYVEPQNPLLFLKKNPNRFIYQSRRDGYNHAYLYNRDGSLVKQLTSGAWEITNIIALDKNDNLFYLSTEESPLEQHAYKLDIGNGRKTKLTSGAATNTVILNPSLEYCIRNGSSTSIPRNIDLMNTNGKLIRNILSAPNPLTQFKMPEMTIGTIKAADGITDLYYRLIKPLDFDTTKKYPAIIYVYGGPSLQLITNKWLGGARLWDYMMAQKGYAVFTVDNRGSSNRGLAFENIIHRQCGQVEMLDQLEGIKFLKQLGCIDTSRIGVHGWSYGGFMTISLMLNYPGIFKTGVAGGPVIDWKYYEVMYGERYMDMPEENTAGYEKTALPAKVKNLKGKLLIIQGAQDPVVVCQNSLFFINECIKNEVSVDYFLYPEAEHNVIGPNRVHLMEKITDYFERNL